MQKLDGRYVYSATDLNNYLECRHLVGLGREVAEGRLRTPEAIDRTAELVARKGDEHERRQLEAYIAEFGDGVVRLDERAGNSREGLFAAEARTVEAMAAGAKIIYQATFFDGQFVGHADFLRRVSRKSVRWEWSYEVIDTKLALSPKPYFLIQLCNYSEHLERLQGTAPENGYVVFGNGEERPFAIERYAAYYRHLKASFAGWMESGGDAYPLETAHCDVCAWSRTCEGRREADDHLSLVAGIRGDQIAKLTGAGITSMTALAEAAQRPQRMSEATFDNLRIQAELQVGARRAAAAGESHPFRYRFREPSDAAEGAPDTAGFAKMPPPAAGDIFFDIEGDPLYRADRGLEYLFGLYLPDEDRYVPFWAKDASEEQAAFEQCVDFIAERLERFPELHVYHYASYEKTALRRLMGTFASRENEIDRFLTIGLFVDLYPVVRQAMWISQPSYSLKKVEKFYRWSRGTTTQGGDDSIVMFESWLATGDAAILEDIRRYNEDDCRSTFALRKWLVALREEFNAGRALPVPWRASRTEPERPDDVERTELEQELLAGIAPPQSLEELRQLPKRQRERWLLGSLLQYHRRENKPDYWAYFERCENVEDLAEFDRKAIGGLRRLVEIEPYKNAPPDRNLTYTFAYPPQENDVGTKPDCPDSRKAAGEVIEHDSAAGIIKLKLSKEMAATLRALIPGKPLPHKPRQNALARIAQALVDGRLESDHPATSALLNAALPRLSGYAAGARLQPDEVGSASIAHAMAQLDGSYLFIQGPPGSGKSTYGAAAIVELLRSGKRVGLMANGHKALHGLLHKIEAEAAAQAFAFTGVHKDSKMTDDSTYRSRLDSPMVRSQDAVEAGDGQLVSGTSHFWVKEDQTARFDVIVVDEAGQVSLADALNASMAARNVVLLGDPQQLPQVVQGSHPIGAGRSVLEHLLDGRDTVAQDRGIFLDVSFRMQPDLARFVSETSYDGRLKAAPSTAANRVDSSGLHGGGMAFIPVEHAGNGRFSLEEAGRIVAEVGALLRDGTFTRSGKAPRRIEQRHILIVAPYNLQRHKIREALAAAGFHNVAVGTVDKFQGQEAPVVFYSMATSSDADLPRDMAFLFDRNRFNVAISRAQCLSVLVCSPQLLDARCRNPEQMQLVSLLCGFVERATEWTAAIEAA